MIEKKIWTISMCLASRLIWRFVSNLNPDCALMKFDGSSFFVKSQSAIFNFCHLTIIFFTIIILLVVLLRNWFFCQIIVGILLNKGQLNSEWIYEVIISPKMPTKNFKYFCPGSLLEGRVGQKSLKFLVGILGEMMTSLIHSEFNWL